MSNEVQGKIWRIDFPTSSLKLVALKLADHADSDGCNIFPSVDSISLETGLSRSTVNECLALLEGAGMLLVESTGHGNMKYRSTTTRMFDLGLLAQLTFERERRLRTPSSHMLKLHQRDPEPGELRPDGKRKTKKIKWLTVERRENCTSPLSGGKRLQPPNGTPPLSGEVPLRSVDPTPPLSGEVPLRSADPTPPLSGPHPSAERTQTFNEPSMNLSPPTPRRRVSARGGIDLIVQELRDDEAIASEVVDNFIDPIVRMRRIDAPDIRFMLATMGRWISNFNPPLHALVEVRELLLELRKATVKQSDIDTVWKEWRSMNIPPCGGVYLEKSKDPEAWQAWFDWTSEAQNWRTTLSTKATGGSLSKLMEMSERVPVPVRWPPGDERNATRPNKSDDEVAA